MSRRNTRRSSSRKSNNYNFYGVIAIFLFTVLLVFPSVALLLTTGLRDSRNTLDNKNLSSDNQSNKSSNTQNNPAKIGDNPLGNNDKKEILPPNDDGTNDNSITPQSIVPAISKNIKTNLTFKNNIRLLLTKQNKIQTIPIEDYIKGVVAAEMPAAFDLEALKAQAIAARTYTFMVLNKNKNGTPYNKDADITDSYKQYQAYLPKETRIKLWPLKDSTALWNKVSKAVDETKGQIMFYKDDIIYAAFHASSYKKTEDGSVLSNNHLPYLKSVSTNDISLGKNLTEKFVISKAKFNNIIKKYDSTYKELPVKNTLKNIKVLSMTPGGRVNRVKINNIVLSGVIVRKILNLRSTNFTLGENKNDLIFNVTGYGHGMGMSQYGADEMALEGNNYQQILKHYYTGIDIMKAY